MFNNKIVGVEIQKAQAHVLNSSAESAELNTNIKDAQDA